MQKKSYRSFEVHIGGIFATPPKKIAPKKMKLGIVKKELMELLMSDVNIVKNVWWAETADSFEEMLLSTGLALGKTKWFAYTWLPPLVFRMKIPKGYSYRVPPKEQVQTVCSIDATILYDGVWFMAFIDKNQFSNIDEHFMSLSYVRDIVISILERCQRFKPLVVPPCIIPKPLTVELHLIKQGKKKRSIPRYIDTVAKGEPPRPIVKYEAEALKITDDNIKDIMLDIYYDLRMSLDIFYLLAIKANTIEGKHRDLLFLYEKICEKLREYLLIPTWNIVQRWRLSNILSKMVSYTQIQLVDNRLLQAYIISDSGQINTFEDKKGILRNMRTYLKECIVKDFAEGVTEYEGLTATLAHVERVSTHYYRILLGLVAIIAGLIGALVSGRIG